MFVGIDVSKANLDVHVRPTGETWRDENTDAGIARIVKRLLALAPAHVVLEASGGYEDDCAVALILAGIPASVVNPKQVRKFAEGVGQLAKTDDIDAAMLSFFGEVVKPPSKELESDDLRELRALVDRRTQLIEMRTMEKNRQEHASPAMSKELEKHVVWLNKRIKDAESDIGRKIRSCAAWRAKAELLESQPGIARTTSAKLIVGLPELGKVSGKEIAALVGVAPYNDESGGREGKRFCRGGREDVRTALYMCVLTGIRHDPKLKALYKRIRGEGSKEQRKQRSKIAIIACMRKLLVVLNAMVRHNTPWNPELA